MSRKRYPEEFKIEAVKQITVAGHSVAEVASRGLMNVLQRSIESKHQSGPSEAY